MFTKAALLLAIASATGVSAQDTPFVDVMQTPFDHQAPLTGTSRCALVNIAMDESGSMKREQLFMEQYAIPRMTNLLMGQEYQYDVVFFCTNGFGWSGSNEDNSFFRHLGCTIGDAGTPSGLVDSSITDWQNTSGGHAEDGYYAIEQSIASVPADVPGVGGSFINIASQCATLGKNMILVTDEDRDVLNEGSTIETVRAAIADNGYILNEVVEVLIQIPNTLITDADTEIGIRVNYPAENLSTPTGEEEHCLPALFPGLPQACSMQPVYDIDNEFITTNVASGRQGDWKIEDNGENPAIYLTNGRGGDTISDYLPLIQDTRGAMWAIGPLRASLDVINEDTENESLAVTNQNTVEAWAEAFVDIKVNEIDCAGQSCNRCLNPPCRTTELGGDPHITTWRNEHYEYHGQCDLVMIKDENWADGLGIDVHIRTKIVRFWSYIKTVAIRIGNDILEIEGSGDPEDEEAHYWINYEYQGEIEDFAGFPLTLNSPAPFKRTWTIDLGTKYKNEFIEIQIYKEFLRVRFSGGKSWGNTVGLLGNFYSGKTLARDGTTVLDDFVELGHEWQVLPAEPKLFHELEHPQFPEKCLEPEDPRGERRRRLEESTVSVEDAEAACATLKDPLSRKDCVYDILATQDIDMVGAF